MDSRPMRALHPLFFFSSSVSRATVVPCVALADGVAVLSLLIATSTKETSYHPNPYSTD